MGVMVIVTENEYDPNSNPRQGCLHFTLYLFFWESYESKYSPSSYG